MLPAPTAALDLLPRRLRGRAQWEEFGLSYSDPEYLLSRSIRTKRPGNQSCGNTSCYNQEIGSTYSPRRVSANAGSGMASSPSNERIIRPMVHDDARSAVLALHSLIATILNDHHSYLKRELPALEGLLRRSILQDSGTFRVTAGRLLPLFLRFRRELEAHMRREEVTLFPLIERLELAIAQGRPAPRNSFGPLSNAIQFMNEDHGFENKLLAMIAGITDDFASPPGASDSYGSSMDRLKAIKLDLAEHVRKEDEVLFPETIRLEQSGGHMDE